MTQQEYSRQMLAELKLTDENAYRERLAIMVEDLPADKAQKLYDEKIALDENNA